MTKILKLTQEQHALVDDELFDYLNQWKWQVRYEKHINGFYAVRSHHIGYFNGKRKRSTVWLHREIMERVLGRELKQGEVVDHINHDPLDNRRDNLRIVSTRQNLQNRKRKTSSKYPGVCWNKQKNMWRAEIMINGKSKHLGLFEDERDAAMAYERACRELVGEELVCKKDG